MRFLRRAMWNNLFRGTKLFYLTEDTVLVVDNIENIGFVMLTKKNLINADSIIGIRIYTGIMK